MNHMKKPQAYTKAHTPQQLAAATIGFLRGETDQTPAHLGPIDEETVCLVEDLVRINELGFITDNSQPGERDEFGSQRAWVDGYCDNMTAHRIDRALASSEVIVISYCPADRASGSLPITRLADGTPTTFAGRYWYESAQGLYENSTELNSWLRTSVCLQIIDPVWGRNDALWPRLIAALKD